MSVYFSVCFLCGVCSCVCELLVECLGNVFVRVYGFVVECQGCVWLVLCRIVFHTFNRVPEDVGVVFVIPV